MKIKSIALTIFSYIALGNANKYDFKVVSIKGENVALGVKYNNNIAPLVATQFPLFSGSVEADNISKYKYVVIDPSTGQQIEEESFEREYSGDTSKTNEVYNRTNKKVEIPSLPQPFKPMFKMGSENIQPIPNDKIYNLYAKCDQAGYENLTNFPFIDGVSKNENKVNCTFNIIYPDGTFSSEGKIHILGFGSRTYRKLSWGVKFEKKFFGRKGFKLRALANDPTLIREKLSTEVYKAIGVPIQEGAYARVIINGDIYGLYTIIDSLNSKWISAYVHGKDNTDVGFTYKLFSTHPDGPFADLKYDGGDDYLYYSDKGTYQLDEYEKSEVRMNNEADKWTSLINFVKLYDNWVKTYGEDTSDNAIEELKKFLNIESTLRILVVDSLTLAIDNFYLYSSNAALYYNPERKNYQFLPYDFDQSLVGSKSNPDLDQENFIKDCVTWVNYNDNEIFNHYFTNNLLKHPQIRNRYDVILAIASREIFDKEKIREYIHANADLIREDVEWNFNLIKDLNIGYKDSEKFSFVNYYTLENFEGNIDYTHVSYIDDVTYDDAPYGLQQLVEERGDYCRASTANVDTSKNENISDDVDISGVLSTFSTKFTLFIIVVQFILTFIF